jgi:hypothetical protein
MEGVISSKRASRRQKVDQACVYCRRSHMTCDNKRPCSRCIRRSIGHLCHDEKRPSRSSGSRRRDSEDMTSSSNVIVPGQDQTSPDGDPDRSFDWSSLGNQSILSQTVQFNQPVFVSEHAGSEFSSLNDFLSMIDDAADSINTDVGIGGVVGVGSSNGNGNTIDTDITKTEGSAEPRAEPIVSDAARDKFFLTAADPSEDISPEVRLKQVIHAKLEAGLLQPFNYVKGYTRLQKYMDNYMNQSSRQRILKPLSIFRPAFRGVAQSLKDVDLVLVEEAFERMLLDYDRVFTSMAIPACLWRRTGEIYRGNKEFAGLVEVNVEDLRDGKLAIYELMSEESAVNYWEKYGNIAFDAGQKAVLTSCNLRTRDGRKRRACCFSFTVRRDQYNIPSCIVGNFIPIHP